MARDSVPETSVERLARYLFDGPPGAGAGARAGADSGAGAAPGADWMATDLTDWLATSPRFRSFAQTHRDKIRKKLRGAADVEARRDLRAELRTAHHLLADRRIELAFEAYGSGKAGPDFTVTFRGERGFNLEVTRLRRTPDATSYGGVLLAKLRQFPPSVPNALLIAVDGERADAAGVDEAVRALRARADRKDEAFFVERGLGGTRWFFERVARLGAVFVLSEAAQGEGRASLWVNRTARMALSPRAARACLVAFRAD